MLRLRPYKSSDAAHIVRWVSDEAAHMAWCAGRVDWPLDQAAFDRYRETIDRTPGAIMMTLTDEAWTPVGYLTMTVRDAETNSVHLSALIVDSSRRGQGLGTAMVELALRFAKEVMGMSRATLNVFGHNHAARACYQKAGFSEISYTPGAYPHGDERWDRCIMAADL